MSTGDDLPDRVNRELAGTDADVEAEFEQRMDDAQRRLEHPRPPSSPGTGAGAAPSPDEVSDGPDQDAAGRPSP